MSETQPNRFAIYDTMTTEELENLLRLDAEGAESDTELLLHIMDILARRNRDSSAPGKTAREGWKVFQAQYSPAVTTQKTTSSVRHWLIRFAAAAAAVILLVTFPLAAESKPDNTLNLKKVWEAVTQWAKDTFSFDIPAPTQPEETVLPAPEEVELDGIIFKLNKAKTAYEVSRAKEWIYGNVEIPDKLNGLPVTAIGHRAFYQQPELTGIVIPGSITTIGSLAFQDCTALQEVTLSPGLTTIDQHAFDSCTALTRITIPDTVTEIWFWAFAETGLTEIEIPGSVKTISGSVFNRCADLKKVTLCEGVTDIEQGAFYNCTSLTEVHIPKSIVRIENSAFKGCTSLGNISIPGKPNPFPVYELEENGLLYRLDFYADSYILYGSREWISGKIEIPSAINGLPVKKIGQVAFRTRSNITGVVIPESVTEIEGHAFESCTGLQEVSLPEGLIFIDYDSFAYCSALKKIHIPSTVTHIGDHAFRNSGLVEIEIPGKIRRLSGSIFHQCTDLKKVTLPMGLETLHYRVFEGCTSLSEIVLPDSVTKVMDGVFKDCTGLTRVTLSNGMTYLDNDLFADCTGLTDVTLPRWLQAIHPGTFANCPNLQNVYLPNTQEKWDKIQIGENNDPLLKAELHFIPYEQ